MLQAPQVTVKEFLQNHFFTSVEAETDVDYRELNVLQMKVCVALYDLAQLMSFSRFVILPGVQAEGLVLRPVGFCCLSAAAS